MKRLIEIDALRGLAVLCMVGFHFAMNGLLLGLWQFEPYQFPSLFFVRLGQFLFLGLVGVSVFLSSRGFKGQSLRGLKIFGCGLLVTVGTYLVFPEDYVRFGVLHLIGISVPVVALFKGKEFWALPAAAFFYALSFVLPLFLQGSVLGIPFGLPPEHFSSLDYFPIFPWMAVPLVGLWVGSKLYARHQGTRLKALAKAKGLTWLGRHSLAVYLLHQPFLYFSLWGLSYWIKP